MAMDNKARLIDAAREIKILDEFGHEIDKKPKILFPGSADPGEIAYARKAGLEIGFFNEEAAYRELLQRKGAAAAILAAAYNEDEKTSRRNFLKKATMAALGAGAIHILGDKAKAQQIQETRQIFISGKPKDPLDPNDPPCYHYSTLVTVKDYDTVLRNIRMMRKLSDPDNPGLDRLEHLIYMNWADGTDGCGRTYSYRWRDEDMPIKVWLNRANAPQGYADLIKSVFGEWGPGLFEEVDYDPTDGYNGAIRPYDPAKSFNTGIRFEYHNPGVQTGYETLEGIPCIAPTKGVIRILNNKDLTNPNHVAILKSLVMHELGHALQFGVPDGTGGRHSKYPNHLMYAVIFGNRTPTWFEKECNAFLYRVALGTPYRNYVGW
jgi:hypothetical protein